MRAVLSLSKGRLLVALAALVLLRADMYPDMSNAVGGKRAGTFYAQAFGACTWGPTTDVGACINAAIEAAYAAGGGTAILPAGTYGVSTPIATGRNNIGIGCNAPAGTRASSDPYSSPPPAEAGGCELKWIGAAGGRIMSFAAPNDSQYIVGAKVENIRFNGNNGLAADGLYLRSSGGGEFNNIRFVGGFNGGNVINLDVVPGEHAVPHGSQWNHFSNTTILNWQYTSNGLKLGYYQSATGLPANASINMFEQLHIYTGLAGTGKGIWCHGCDNNTFKTTYISTDGPVTVDLDIYTENGRWFPANNNVFDHLGHGYPTGTVIARGKTTYPTCAAFSFPSFGTCTWGNELRRLDGSNGSPPPTIEPGAYIRYGFDYGAEVNFGGAFLASDGVRAAQTLMGGLSGLHACGNDSATYGASVGAHYCFGAGQTAQLYSNASTVVGQQDHFTVGFVGTPGAMDLRVDHPLGTGRYVFGMPIALTGGLIGNLPGCNVSTKNSIQAVTDQLGAPTYRGALTGGGTIAVLAFCNGTSWEAH